MAIKLLSKAFKAILLLLFALTTNGLAITPVMAQESKPLPEYIIQQGETLSSIAVRFGVSVDDILAVNDLDDPNNISIGSKIRIPGLEGIEGILEKKTVPFGDSLNSISLTYQLSIPTLIKLNHISTPSEIYAGSELVVPVKDSAINFTPATKIDNNESLLEAAIQENTNPWVFTLSNNLSGSWDLADHQTIFSPKTETTNFSPISPLIESIDIFPLPLMQGKTTEILVKTTQAVELSGKFGDTELPFFKISDNEYLSLTGMPAMIDPGLYGVSLSGKAVTTSDDFYYSQQVLLVSGDYSSEVVEGVEAVTIDPASIAEEDKILSSVQGTELQPLWTTNFSYPVDDPCLASVYGTRRTYNQGQYDYYHTGQDFSVCANNLNIYAAAPGIVKFTGLLPTKGNFTLIDHGIGVYTGYAHQSQILVNIGDHVEAGQQIGVIGNTGRSVGPHLHWEVWVNHVPVNPMDWILNQYPIVNPTK